MPALIPDVNTLVYAHRPEMVHHSAARTWLEEALTQRQAILLPEIVIVGFLRLMTNPRVFAEPMSMADAVRVVDNMLAWPGVERGAAPHRFASLAELSPAAVGDRVPDAYVGAIAAEASAIVVTWDRAFERFNGVQWLTPPG